jgi:L-glyceraldehyde 3-phosphate reductase
VRGLTEKMLTEANLNSLRLLNEMAQARGQTMAQMALSWLLKDARVTSVLIGASRPEQLEETFRRWITCALPRTSWNGLTSMLRMGS